MADPYRDGEALARTRLERLRAARRAELEALPAAPRRVYRARVARVAAGGLGALLGATALAIGMVWPLLSFTPDLLLVLLLVAGLLVPALVYPVARVSAGPLLRRTLAGELAGTDDVYADLERLGRRPVRDALLERCAALEAPSVALPMVATLLLVPRWLDLGVGLFANDELFQVALVVTAPSLLVVALVAARLALRLAASPRPPRELAHGVAFRAWWLGAMASALGVVLGPALIGGHLGFSSGSDEWMSISGLMMAYVAATNLTYLPWTFRWAVARVERERALLAAAAAAPEGAPSRAGGAGP